MTRCDLVNDEAYNPEGSEIREWLVWTHAFLETRALSHRKYHLKQTTLRKMAETLLAPDELERIDKEVEDKL